MGKCAASVRFIAWLVNRTPAARAQLTNWNRTFQFSLSGERPFFVASSDNRMKYGSGEVGKPDVVFKSESDAFFDVLAGKTKFDQGFSRGIYTLHGSLTDAVKLNRVAESALESHPTLSKIVRSASRMLG